MGVTDDTSDQQSNPVDGNRVVALAALTFEPSLRKPPWPNQSRLPPDLDVSHAMLIDLFGRVETLEVQCSNLQDEYLQAEHAQVERLGDAQTRIHDLEDAVSGLMEVIHQYEALLATANARIADAEQRASDAEHWIRTAERGTSEAVEWLYHHVTRMLEEPR